LSLCRLVSRETAPDSIEHTEEYVAQLGSCCNSLSDARFLPPRHVVCAMDSNELIEEAQSLLERNRLPADHVAVGIMLV
jgi:hypothetical protein